MKGIPLWVYLIYYAKLDNLSNVWVLQAILHNIIKPYGSGQEYYIVGSNLGSIKIPRIYTKLLMRKSWNINHTDSASEYLYNLEEIKPNEKLGSETQLVFEGKDKNYFIFHAEYVDGLTWLDDSCFIYAK